MLFVGRAVAGIVEEANRAGPARPVLAANSSKAFSMAMRPASETIAMFASAKPILSSAALMSAMSFLGFSSGPASWA